MGYRKTRTSSNRNAHLQDWRQTIWNYKWIDYNPRHCRFVWFFFRLAVWKNIYTSILFDWLIRLTSLDHANKRGLCQIDCKKQLTLPSVQQASVFQYDYASRLCLRSWGGGQVKGDKNQRHNWGYFLIFSLLAQPLETTLRKHEEEHY